MADFLPRTERKAPPAANSTDCPRALLRRSPFEELLARLAASNWNCSRRRRSSGVRRELLMAIFRRSIPANGVAQFAGQKCVARPLISNTEWWANVFSL